jgi:hypothetical protein
LGGAGEDFIRNVDVEDGKIYVDGGVGFSGPPSADPDNPDGSFPTTESAFEREFRGGSSDIMIAVIDPDTAGPNGLMYSTLLGGSGWDIGHGLDARDGFIYVTGRCQSPDLQTGPTGVVQPDFAGGLEDAFVSKWDPTKSGDASRIYVTFLGGSLFDNGLEVRADADGSAFVTGITSSSDYPTTAGAFQETFGGGFADVYVTKLNADGTQILYSTYIGGGATEMPLGLALNDKSQVAVTGKVQGDDYPTTPGAFLETSPTPNVPFDLSGSTNSLRFAFGTEGYTVSVGSGALDPDFGPEVTFSGDPSLPFPIDDDYATISLAGFFTFPFQDQVYATIFVNSDGNITFGEPDPASTPRDTKRLVSGSPRIAPYLIDVAFLGRGSGTVHAKVLANQAVVTYSGVMDGNTIQVTLYSSGNIEIVYGMVKTRPNVVGISEGNNKGPFLETDLSAADGTLIGRTIFEEFGTNQQYIIAMLNSTGSDLIYSTFLGGDGPTTWGPVAVDTDSNLYVTSFNTSSANFPVTPNAFDETYNGDSDTFVAKLATTPQAWIETIIQEVGGLREHGVINRRQKVALVVELELARAGIDAGRPDVATERLNAFAKTVDRLVDNGVLSTAQGESLDDLGSEKVIRQVEYLVAIGEIETDDDD